MLRTAILLGTAILSIIAAILSLRMIKLTGKRTVWIIVAATLVFLITYKLVTYTRVLTSDTFVPPVAQNTWIAAGYVIVITLGLLWLRPIIKDLLKTHEVANQNAQRYGTLFRSAPIAMGEADWSAVKTCLDSLKSQGIFDFTGYFDTHPDAITHCLEQVKLLDINAEGLALLQADNKADVTAGQMNLFTTDVSGGLKELLIGLAEGQTHTQAAATIKTLKGQTRQIVLYFTVAPGCEDTWERVLLSIADVTQQKRAEAARALSEEKFSKTFHTSPNAISINRAESGTYVNVNLGFTELSGYTEKEVIGKTPDDLNIWAYPEEFQNFLDILDQSGAVYNFEAHFRAKDGSIHIGLISTSSFEVAGEPYDLSITRDITAQKEVQLALEENAQHLLILREIDQNILLARSPAEIADAVLPRLPALMPCDRATLIEFDPEIEKGKVISLYNANMTPENGQITSMEIPLPSDESFRRGEPLLLSGEKISGNDPVSRMMREQGFKNIIIMPMMNNNRLVGSLNVATRREKPFAAHHVDITRGLAASLAISLHQANLYQSLAEHAAQLQAHSDQLEQAVQTRTADLEAAMHDLQQLTRVKDEFVSNVSHELRTPITNLKLHHELLSLNPEKHDAYMGTLIRETERLENIVESLLHLSRLDQGRTRYNPISFDLEQLARSYIDDRQLLAEQKKITLSFTPCDDCQPVLGDPVMIGQAVSVLLTNALNYTGPGDSVEVKARCEKREDALWCGLTVSDSGPGIPDEEHERLFERFFRGAAARAAGTPGTGLGLAIAKEIVDIHKGQITVEKEGLGGRGTAFTIWLKTAP